MKRIVCLLLALALLSGCLPQSLARHETAVQLYYVSADPDYFSSLGILTVEKRTLNESQNSIEGLMDRFLDGPISPEMVSPIPKGLRLIRAETAQGASPREITLVFDDALADLGGIHLQLACACIAFTVSDYGNFETVNIRAETQPLEGDREQITVRPGELVLEDHSAGQPNALVLLYFADSGGRFLIGEQRSVTGDDSANLPEFIVRSLIEGPQSDVLLPTVPKGSMLLNVSVVDRVCMVNFSEEFLSNRPETALEERLTVFSVVNSLAQLDEVDSVDIMVQGRKMERYLYLDLSGDLTPDERLTGPVRGGVGEFDATLYVCLEGSERLAAFPMRIREAVDLNRIGPVLDELCGFAESNGYYSPANGPVRNHREQLEDGVLSVLLDTETLDGDQLRLLSRSVISTLMELPEVQRIRLFINGEEIDRSGDPYSSDWFLP